MYDAAAALALLQYGDSAYPAGGFAFSWGVEGLAADGYLDGREGLDGHARHSCLALPHPLNRSSQPIGVG